MVRAAGSDRLPQAVPLICNPGDVAITNRQAIHGSFANTSRRPRVTINPVSALAPGFTRRFFSIGGSGAIPEPAGDTPAKKRGIKKLER